MKVLTWLVMNVFVTNKSTSWLLLPTILISLCKVNLWANDRLIIISPHRKSMQKEFIPLFKQHYRHAYNQAITVEWVDQGGTENDLRFIKAKFAASKHTSSLDVFWGGGEMPFHELDQLKLLLPIKLPQTIQAQIPQQAVGLQMYSDNKTWYASALSSFGLFYNKRLLKMKRLNEPKEWQDLVDPAFYNLVSAADPRRSGTSLVMTLIMLQSYGWQQGWQLLTGLAGNIGKFTHSSSDPIKAVVSANAAVATSIDFYALAKVSSLGTNNLGFKLPVGKTVFNADAIAILKGAPNLLAARRFVAFILSAKTQKKLFYPKGHPLGPKYAFLGRMAVNQHSYTRYPKNLETINPFTLPAQEFKFDNSHTTKIKKVISDAVGAFHIDTHHYLKKAWHQLVVIEKSTNKKALTELYAPPFTQQQLYVLSNKWSDNVFRNQTINKWVNRAISKYKRLAKNNNANAT